MPPPPYLRPLTTRTMASYGAAAAASRHERTREALASHGLEHIADRTSIECIDRVFVVGRGEDDGRVVRDGFDVAERTEVPADVNNPRSELTTKEAVSSSANPLVASWE